MPSDFAFERATSGYKGIMPQNQLSAPSRVTNFGLIFPHMGPLLSSRRRMATMHNRLVFHVVKGGSAPTQKIIAVIEKLHFSKFKKNSTRNFLNFFNIFFNFFRWIWCRIWRRFRICAYFFATIPKNWVMVEKRKTKLKIRFPPVKWLFRGNFKISSGFSGSTSNLGLGTWLSRKSEGVVKWGPK